MRLLFCLSSVLLIFVSSNSLASKKAEVFFTLEFHKYAADANSIDMGWLKAEDWLTYKKRIHVDRHSFRRHTVLREMAEKSENPSWLPRLQNLVDAVSKVDLGTAEVDFYKKGYPRVEIRMFRDVYASSNWFNHVYLDIRDPRDGKCIAFVTLREEFLEGGRLPEVSDLAGKQMGILIREAARPGSTDPAQIEKEKKVAAAAIRAEKDRRVIDDLRKAHRFLKSHQTDTFNPEQIELLEKMSKTVDDMKLRKRN